MTLAEMAQRAAAIERSLSPVAQSPNTSAPPSEQRRASRIPTPIHSPGHLAMPRQEREDSASSLLTGIKDTGISWGRDSILNPGYSSRSASRVDVTDGDAISFGGPAWSGGGNFLPDHSRLLRGNAFAAAAAKTAYQSSTGGNGCDAQHTVPRVQSRAQDSRAICKPVTTKVEDENITPIIPLGSLIGE